MSEVVYVTNKSGKDLVIDYCYADYVFPVNKTIEVSVKLAKHIFGYMDDDKEKYLIALGLIRFHSELEQATKRLALYEITESPPVKNSSLPSAVGVVPLRVEKHVGGKVIARAA